MLEIAFDGANRFNLSCEYLRVNSPSAEIRGYGAGQKILQTEKKRDVSILTVEPVGNYAVNLVYSDAHDTGLCARDYLYSLGVDYDTLWKSALVRPNKAAASRGA